MVTFRIPSIMVESGRSAPSQGLGADRNHAFGDGSSARIVLLAIEPLLFGLTMCGYHASSVHIRLGNHMGGQWMALENLAVHLGYSIDSGDWTAATGFAPGDADALMVAIGLEERTRYIGLGPSFAVPLPNLSTIAPHTDTAAGTDREVASETVTIFTSRASAADPALMGGIQLEVRHLQGDDYLGFLNMGLMAASRAAALATRDDLVAAADPSWAQISDGTETGLLRMYLAPGWDYGAPWVEDADRNLIDKLGRELLTAHEGGTLTTEQLLDGDIVGTASFEEQLMVARNLPTPPAVASDIDAALGRRLAIVSGSRWPPVGGPFSGAHRGSYARMLMLAHELRVIDVLGTSGTADSPADVAQVQGIRVDIDVTGFYESRWDGWDTVDNLSRIRNGAGTAPWVGCFQINQAGRAIIGWWQTRVRDTDNGTGYMSIVQRPFVAEVHDGSDESKPVLKFKFGLDWCGLMSFDTDADGTRTVRVQHGPVVTGSNQVQVIDVPPEMCTQYEYARVTGKPHLHDAAISSLPAATEDRVRALHRVPSHQAERKIVEDATGVLRAKVETWLNAAPGGFKTGTALGADQHLAAELAVYLHASADAHLLESLKRHLRTELYARSVVYGGVHFSAYNQTANMVSQQVAQTPTIARLLDLQPELVVDANAFVYDWELDTWGVAGDLPPGPQGIPLGGGAFHGSMLITKRRGGQTEWQNTYTAEIAEGSTGLSAGLAFSKITSGTIVSNADWDDTDFEGGFEMEGAESGFIFFRYGWAGRITFHGSGRNSPLTGDASGLNWVFGPSVAAADVGVAGGTLSLGAPVDIPTIDPTLEAVYARQHAEARDGADEDAFFAFDQSVVRPTFIPRLEAICAGHLAAFMSPEGGLVINGHASAPGSEPVNEALSFRRARAVYETMQLLLGERLLVPEERTEFIASGESQAPGGPDGPDVAEARRVDVSLDAQILIGY